MNETALDLGRSEATALGNRDVAENIHGLRFLNVERFNNSFFFNIKISRGGFRVKVRDGAKLAAYLGQLATEITGLRAQLASEGLSEKDIAKRLRQETTAAGAVELDDRTLAAIASGNVTLPKTISTTKQLLVSPALDELNEFLTATKTRLCGPFGVAVPSRINEGLFVVPASEVEKFEADLRASVAKLRSGFVTPEMDNHPGYVPAFVADYEAAKERARTMPLLKGGLGPLFDPSDYPQPGEIAGMFDLQWGWLALGVPAGLPESIRAEAQAKFQSQVDEAAAEVKTAMYVQLGELLNHMKERLTTAPGEKQKIFRDSAIGNILQFCEVFQTRNGIFNDQALAGIVGQVRTVLQGVTPEKVREFSSVRDNITKQFGEITAQLDAAIETRKGRKLYLDE